MVQVLKKEVQKTNNVVEQEDNDKYRQLLVRTLHTCSVKFPDICPTVIPMVSLLLLWTCARFKNQHVTWALEPV